MSWTPVAHVLPPGPGHIEIPAFTAAENRVFQLFLYGKSAGDACPESAIDWTVLRGGIKVASGFSKADHLAFFDNAVACRMGEFQAQKGERYRVLLDVRKMGLHEARLLVQTHPNAWLDAFTGKALYREQAGWASVLLALAGMTILAVVPILKRITATTR